jgi:hypothetical protein
VDEVMETREAAAREVKHTIVPAYNKGPYVVLWDETLLKDGFGRKQ